MGLLLLGVWILPGGKPMLSVEGEPGQSVPESVLHS